MCQKCQKFLCRCLNPGSVVKRESGEPQDNRPSSPAESLRSFKDLPLPPRPRLPGLPSPPPSPSPSHPSFPPPVNPTQHLATPQKPRESAAVSDGSNTRFDANKEAGSVKKRKGDSPGNQNSKRRKNAERRQF